jgi:hypothetical protein
MMDGSRGDDKDRLPSQTIITEQEDAANQTKAPG